MATYGWEHGTDWLSFNGLDFTVFNTFNTPELGGNTINALDETEDGTLVDWHE